MAGRALVALLLTACAGLAGCQDDAASSDAAPSSDPAAADTPRDYLFLEIEGDVTREPPSPPHTGAACGRTGHPFARVDVANRSLYLVQPGGVPMGGHDLDRNATWIVVWDKLVPGSNACGSRPALWAAERSSFEWSFGVNGGAFNVSVERRAGAVWLDGESLLAPGNSTVLHREFYADGARTWSDITFRLHGGWSTADVHDVGSEHDLPEVGQGGSWHKDLPR